jgi:BASS family bile acid:Na+ symporter
MASSVMAEDEESPNMDNVRKKVQILCNLFPLWIVLTAATALKLPSLYLGIPPSTFPSQIGLLMLCMGISLKPADFKRVLQRPGKSKNE